MSKKRNMNSQEKRFVSLACGGGCIICGVEAEWHHLPGAREVNAHTQGYPLCYEHHRGDAYPGQSIHSNRLLFTQVQGDEMVLAQMATLRVVALLESKKQTIIKRRVK